MPTLAKRCWCRIRELECYCLTEEVCVAMVQKRTGRVERRLVAILAADVAGYSRLMHDDEEATHARGAFVSVSASISAM